MLNPWNIYLHQNISAEMNDYSFGNTAGRFIRVQL